MPVDRTEGDRPFQVVGVDFAGPIKYRVAKKTEGKAYITLDVCSLTFVASAKWLKKAQQDGKFNHFLANEKIKWQFNLSRAPGGGGGGNSNEWSVWSSPRYTSLLGMAS